MPTYKQWVNKLMQRPSVRIEVTSARKAKTTILTLQK